MKAHKTAQRALCASETVSGCSCLPFSFTSPYEARAFQTFSISSFSNFFWLPFLPAQICSPHNRPRLRSSRLVLHLVRSLSFYLYPPHNDCLQPKSNPTCRRRPWMRSMSPDIEKLTAKQLLPSCSSPSSGSKCLVSAFIFLAVTFVS